MHLLLAPECTPFAIAAVMLAGLTAIEILATTIGFSISEWIGKPETDGQSGLAGMLSWLNVGGVPTLILLMLVLGFFAMTGFIVQAVADVFWSPLPALIAMVPSVIATIPLVRGSSKAVARFVPRDETYVVDIADFIGRTGQVVTGPLDQGLPGRVRTKDTHGNWHTLRARAAAGEQPIAIGATVLFVDIKADIFVAIFAPDDLVDGPHTNKGQS